MGAGSAANLVIACDKREAFGQGSVATKQSIFQRAWKDGLLRFARNDVERAEFVSYPVSIGSDVSLAHSPIEPS